MIEISHWRSQQSLNPKNIHRRNICLKVKKFLADDYVSANSRKNLNKWNCQWYWKILFATVARRDSAKGLPCLCRHPCVKYIRSGLRGTAGCFKLQMHYGDSSSNSFLCFLRKRMFAMVNIYIEPIVSFRNSHQCELWDCQTSIANGYCYHGGGCRFGCLKLIEWRGNIWSRLMFLVVRHVADICGIRPGISKYDRPAEVAPFVRVKLSLALALSAFHFPLYAKVSLAVELLFCNKNIAHAQRRSTRNHFFPKYIANAISGIRGGR